jgi:Fe2+ transport system protein FeoA
MKCPLCGCEFPEGATTLCQRCPLQRNCELICCPNCGYQWPQQSSVVNLMRRIFQRNGNAADSGSGSRVSKGAAKEGKKETLAAAEAPRRPFRRLLSALQRLANEWLLPMFRHRPLGPELAPEVVRAFEIHRQRIAAQGGGPLSHGGSSVDSLELRPLSDLKVGQRAQVLSVAPDSEARIHRLNSLGVVPGSPIELHQKQPSFVVKVDETLLAIDREVASKIYVVVANGTPG